MKVALTTLGCKVNQFETETMEGLFKQRGYEVVPFDACADVYVINTCSVTSLGDQGRIILGQITQLFPVGGKVGVYLFRHWAFAIIAQEVLLEESGKL